MNDDLQRMAFSITGSQKGRELLSARQRSSNMNKRRRSRDNPISDGNSII